MSLSSACDSEDTDGGSATSGEMSSAGETPAGETPAGETPAGETPAGETPAGETPAGETPAGEVTAGTMTQMGLPMDELIAQVATSTCNAINRCCNGSEIDLFWQGISNHPRLEDERDLYPPQTPYDPATCEELLARAYTVTPLGGWIEAVNRGFSTYDGVVAETCIAKLDEAACGQETVSAIFDGSCFGFQPPSGRDRSMFTRMSETGQECMAVADGASGSFFGTCDPETAWCASQGDNGNTITFAGELGQCVLAGTEGDGCGLFPEAAICTRGTTCSIDDTCVVEGDLATAGVDEPCFDSSTFISLAICADSYCDVLGTGTCLSLKMTGEACTGSDECVSKNCSEGQCIAREFCSGL
jgi:hypothetical protein